MNRIFSIYNPGSLASTYTIREAKPVAASGISVFFASILSPKEVKKPFLPTLVELIEILRIQRVYYQPAPPITPWARPRQLRVPKLPCPVFFTHSLIRTPTPREFDEFEPYPLMRDMDDLSPRELYRLNVSCHAA